MSKIHKWTFEECMEIAITCNKKVDFKRKNQGAYNAARKNGWIDKFDWFMTTEEARHLPRPKRRKWNYEKCYKIASTCRTLSEFERNHNAAACISRKYGWLQSFSWLKRATEIYNPNGDSVYAYIFNDLHSVYVGRTVHTQKRDFIHRTNKSSSVFRFAKENKVKIPVMTILEDGLTVKEGLEKEDYYKNKYKSEGWNIINIAKTGVKSGSVGSLVKKWNKKSCKKESLKYNTLKDFMTNSESAYKVASKNGWIKEYVWLKRKSLPSNYWTEEKCMEEAGKYNSLADFSKNSSGACTKAYNKGWIDDYVWLKRKHIWSYEEVYNIARKYHTLKDFREKDELVLAIAIRNKWLDSFEWLERKNRTKRVEQYTRNGVLVNSFTSIHEASRLTGVAYSGISYCCNGKLCHYKGYVWKFVE